MQTAVMLCGVTAALLAAPAGASACPSFASVPSFHGSASASFDQTASSSGQAGITTVTLDRVADGIQYPKLAPASLGNGLVTFSGTPEGGSVSVNDSYSFTSNNGGSNDSGGQTAGGPTLGYPAAANGGISFYPAQLGCRYGVIFSFAIATTQIGDWPYGPGDTHPDGQAIGLIYGPERPIPANLQLSGTATVVWQADPSAGSGTYRATVTGTSAWAQEYSTLLSDSGMAPGMATISWNFSPGSAAAGCSTGSGGTTAAADRGARAAQQTQPVACQTGPPEPGKVYTLPEKAQAAKQRQAVAQFLAKTCHFFVGRQSVFDVPLLDVACVQATSWAAHLASIEADPPNPDVFLVALPVVRAPKGPKLRCPFAARICRRGRSLARAYDYVFAHENAAAGALATTLDRLSATPAQPESLYGSGFAATPLYSRRTQVAAARLYSGLLAAWSDRMKAPRANLVGFLKSLGGKARLASRRLPPVLPADLLWQTFHQMTAYELAQLTEDLVSQQIQVPLANYDKHHRSAAARIAGLVRKLNAVHSKLETDLNAILAATSQRARSAAANRFARDARRIIGIRRLATYASHVSLTVQLLAFASGALTNSNPIPVSAP